MFKKFLAYLLIISLLLPALPVQAEGIYKMVGSGAVTQPNMKISAVNGTAFIDLTATTFEGGLPVTSGSIAVNSALMDTTTANAFLGGLDVSSYQDGNYKIRLKDSAGKVAEAWISDTAPGGVTLDGTLTLNGVDFTGGPPPTSWTSVRNGVLTSEAGGEAGNYLRVAFNGSGAPSALQTCAVTTSGLYKFSSYNYCFAPASGALSVLGSTSDGSEYGVFTVTDAAWTLVEKYITATTTLFSTRLHTNIGGAGYAGYDTVALQRVTDCAATGGLLLSTKGGSRGFKTLDTGFNPNLALTYEIFSANPLPLHKGYLLKVRDSSKRAIQGYVKAAGTGETLDVERIGASWTDAGRPFNTFITAGVDITSAINTDGTSDLAYNVNTAPSIGELVKVTRTYTLNSGTLNFYVLASGTSRDDPVINLSGDSSYATIVSTAQKYLTYHSLAVVNFSATGHSVKKVLTPSATGVTITSTKGGSTFNFAALDSAFNYNDSSGYTYELWQVNNAVEVASGSIAANQMLADTTATNAFVAPVGVDLSAYQTGKYVFAAYNTVGGYAAFGYIKGTAPGGEAFGVEKLTGDASTFTAGVGGWDTWYGINSITAAGGKGRVDFTSAGVRGPATSILTIGMLAKVITKAAAVSGTTTIQFGDGNGSQLSFSITGVETEYTGYFTVTYSSYLTHMGVGAGVWDLDDITWKQVTDCAATGALIVSAKDGATRDWAYKHASFNSNKASTFKIFYVGD